VRNLFLKLGSMLLRTSSGLSLVFAPSATPTAAWDADRPTRVLLSQSSVSAILSMRAWCLREREQGHGNTNGDAVLETGWTRKLDRASLSGHHGESRDGGMADHASRSRNGPRSRCDEGHRGDRTRGRKRGACDRCRRTFKWPPPADACISPDPLRAVL